MCVVLCVFGVFLFFWVCVDCFVMDVPGVVRVGPYVYRVVLVGDDDPVLGGDLGCSSFEELCIWVRGSLPLGIFCGVLLHEVLHACLYSSIGVSLDIVFEEFLVGALQSVLLGVLVDNPGLVGFLCGLGGSGGLVSE